MTSRQKFFIILSTNENKSVGNVICLRNSVQEMSINNNDFLPLQLLLFETLQKKNSLYVSPNSANRLQRKSIKTINLIKNRLHIYL